MAIPAGSFWPDFMKNQAGNLVCTYLADRGGAALGGFAGGAAGTYFGPAGSGTGAAVGSYLGGAAGSALGALWCPTSSPDTGTFPLKRPAPPSFGHCDGVQYGGTLEYERNDGLVQTAGTGGFWGPAGPVVIFNNNIGGTTIAITCRGHFQSPIKPYGYLLPMVEGGGAAGIYVRGTIKTLNRFDNQPDNCPPPAGPPTTIPRVPTDIPDLKNDPKAKKPINIDVDFGGPVININGDLYLTGPNIGPDGGLEICFNFDGLTFCLLPDGGVRVGPGARRPDLPTPPPTPPPTPTPPETELGGIFYTVLNAVQKQQADVITNSAYFYPRFGSVRFKGGGEFSESYEMRVSSGFIENPAPSKFNAHEFTPYHVGNTASFREFLTPKPKAPT
jgi:hypothetical protein